MERKDYSKPYLVVEFFNPQEYIATCTFQSIAGLITHNSNYFIDWNRDGNYDTGERYARGNFTSSTIKKTKSHIYWLARTDTPDTSREMTPNADAPYSGIYHHYYNGNTTDYQFIKYTDEEVNIKIIDNIIQYSNNQS